MKHGRACRLRSFPITCKFCGAKLLFWECQHGCKLMFEFDKNGRLAGHHKCSGSMANIRPSRKLKPRPPAIAESGFDISSVSKAFIERLFKTAYQCPVCKVKFMTEIGYYQHLRQKRALDDAHEAFYRDNGQVIEKLDAGTMEPDVAQPPGSDPSIHSPPTSAALASLKPDRVTPFPEDSSTINAFGGIRFKSKDGTVKMVKTYKDWWEEFTGNENEKGANC